MGVQEALMRTGSWSLRLKPETPKRIRDLLDWNVTSVAGFGHVFIYPTRTDPSQVSSADAFTNARFAGILREWTDERTISGPSANAWLGDEDDKGPIIETAVTQTAATAATWAAAIKPASLNAGSYAASGSHTATYQSITPRKALDQICAALGMEWQVTPQLKLNVAAASTLWSSTPTAILTRNAASKNDGDLTGVQATVMSAKRTLLDYTTKVDVVSRNGTGSSTGSTSFKDINGNSVSFIRVVSVQDGNNASSTAATILAQYNTAQSVIRLETDLYDIHSVVDVGAYIWAYDVDAHLIDTANQITYQGQTIAPVKLRVYGLDWPVAEGMGVWFRDGSGIWTDLTRWVDYTTETGTTRIDVGAYRQTIGNATSPNANPVEITGPVPHSTVASVTPTGVFSTASTTYVDLPSAGTGGPVSINFVKYLAATKLIATITVTGYSNISGSRPAAAVRINGTEYYAATLYYQTTGDHLGWSGQVEVTGITAGTYTITSRVLLTVAARDWRCDTNDLVTVQITETF